MSKRRSIWLLPIVGLLISGCATSGKGQTSSSHGGSSVGVGVGAGSGGVGVSSGVKVSPGYDPVLNSTLTGAAIGALGGPIGLGVGAALGYVHGLAERGRLEKQAKAEADRQAQLNEALEREIEAKRNSPAAAGMEGSTGLILVEDHVAPEREIASSSPPAAPSEGEGLVLLTDHLAPATPPKEPTTAQTQGSSATAATTAQVGAEEPNEVEASRKELDEQIAVARERQRELREALQGTAATPETPGAAGSPMKEPPPTIDPEGFRVVYAGGRLVRKERDVNGDGRSDTIRYYDETGRLARQEEDSRLDGRLDTWTFYEDGHPARKESDTNGDGNVDLWAFYDGPNDLVRTEADTDHDAHRDRVVLYAQGKMVEEQRYRPGLDPPTLRITYVKEQPTRKEEDVDRDGRLDRLTEYDESGRVTKVSRNPADDGTFTLFAYYQPKTGAVLREEEDLDGDGKIDVISYYESARLVRREFFDLPEVASLKPQLSVPHAPSEGKTP